MRWLSFLNKHENGQKYVCKIVNAHQDPIRLTVEPTTLGCLLDLGQEAIIRDEAGFKDPLVISYSEDGIAGWAGNMPRIEADGRSINRD